MEFSARNGQPSPLNAPAGNRPAGAAGKKGRRKVYRLALTFVILGLVILVAGLGYKFFMKSESAFLDKGKYQAVFLNGGQVYFGKVDSMNKEFMVVKDIYYLRVNEQQEEGENQNQNQDQNQQQAQQDISLAKLGCELHGPEDEMVINREQVTFWENLKDDGQVAKAIAEFAKQNPDGQKCDQPAAS